MKKILALAIIVLIGCSSTRNNGKLTTSESIEKSQRITQDFSCVQGTVIDEDGVPVPYVNVTIMESEQVLSGVSTDFEGKFKLCVQRAGSYELQVNFIGFAQIRKIIDLTPGQTVSMEEKMLMLKNEVELLKPMLYLYPNDTMKVNVEINCKGGLTHTYPKYEDGWEVTAHPDGTLHDANGRSYYGLYWEGNSLDNFTIDEGFVVKGNETIPFLEKALSTLGLNEREANEFIVYWLPILKRNPYNLIHFSQEEYQEMAPLTISPEPEHVIRVMMVYEPLSHPIEIAQQILKEIKRYKSGFTVVEWGGARNQTFLSYEK
ncbi:MAG: carboxypeptidase regulatory-like domain-containing protein [Bacteroidota bacterium]